MLETCYQYERIEAGCDEAGRGCLAGAVFAAAASVLAKTHRDEYMRRLAEEFPQYGWAKNKGYPTREHRLAVSRYGVTPYHRLTFNHESGQLELF